MYPDSVSPITAQRGVGLPMAIFMITVLALIVATMAQMQQGAAQRVGLDALSARAFYAAESGAQIALTRLFPAPDGTGGTASDFSQSFNTGGLLGCSAAVSYLTATADGTNYYRIKSIGTCGSGESMGRRVVEVRAR